MGGRSKEMTTFISYLASSSIDKAGHRGRKRRQASMLHALQKSNNRIQSDKQSDDAVVQLPGDLKSISFASWYQPTIMSTNRRNIFKRRKRLPMIREEWGRRFSAPPNLMLPAPINREDERLIISSSDDETTISN